MVTGSSHPGAGSSSTGGRLWAERWARRPATGTAQSQPTPLENGFCFALLISKLLRDPSVMQTVWNYTALIYHVFS